MTPLFVTKVVIRRGSVTSAVEKGNGEFIRAVREGWRFGVGGGAERKKRGEEKGGKEGGARNDWTVFDSNTAVLLTKLFGSLRRSLQLSLIHI